MARSRPPAAGEAPLATLADRLAYDLAMTGGRMPIDVVVADEEERALALRFLAGKRNARLLTVRTREEAQRGKRRG